MEIVVHEAIKNFVFLASKCFFMSQGTFSFIKLSLLYRGGVAVVWLGKRDGKNVAMKQFPKNGTGNHKFDPSAYVELQMAQIIRKYSTREGKKNPIYEKLKKDGNFLTTVFKFVPE